MQNNRYGGGPRDGETRHSSTPRVGTGLPRKDGTINQSIYKMREELVQRKIKKEKYGRIGSWGVMVGCLPLLGLFFLNGADLKGTWQYLTNPWVISGGVIILFSYAFNRVYYQKASDKFDSLKEELISKIWNDFCNCWSACSHKEDFLQETDEKYGINLYWK